MSSIENMDELNSNLELTERQYVQNNSPPEIILLETSGSYQAPRHISEKQINKLVISTENQAYLKFDISKAEQGIEFMGKHLAEMLRDPQDDIPQIFTLLFGYFDEDPEHLKQEGIFRKGGDEETM